MDVQDEQPFEDWIGRTSEAQDVVTERLAASFRAIFEDNLAPVDDGEAPLGMHWCLSPAIAPMSALGPDGHPAKNRDLPPVSAPRRMWAGGSVECFDPLRIGDHVTRVSTITDIMRKQGRSGELWFVAVDHDYLTSRGLAVRERHDIVYRQAATQTASEQRTPDDEPPPARDVRRRWDVHTSPTFLFRYSAISFNGHRIHYDLPYVTEVEGYAGLVVHGPIQATLLLNLATVEHGGAPLRLDYRGLSPAIAGQTLSTCTGQVGGETVFWTQGPEGHIHMEARARTR